MRVALVIGAAALAAACAEPRSAAAPAAPPKPAGPAVAAKDGVIRVTAPIANEDALAPLHCFAAKQARADGAPAMEWVGGIAKPKSGGGYDADMVYEIRSSAPRRAGSPAEGGAAAVEAWMIYCDEAGIPREGEA